MLLDVEGFWKDIPILENDIRCCCAKDDGKAIGSMSTRGQDVRCCCWNLGWYGSSILIFPHLWKNNPIAPIHNIKTNNTIKASSGLTTNFGPVNEIKFKKFI